MSDDIEPVDISPEEHAEIAKQIAEEREDKKKTFFMRANRLRRLVALEAPSLIGHREKNLLLKIIIDLEPEDLADALARAEEEWQKDVAENAQASELDDTE